MRTILLTLLLSSVTWAAEPWVYPSTQVGTVTCVSARDGTELSFRTETVTVENERYFYIATDNEGGTRRIRAQDFVCTVVVDQ